MEQILKQFISQIRCREAYISGLMVGNYFTYDEALEKANSDYPLPKVDEGEWSPEIVEAMRVPQIEAKGNYFPYESLDSITF